MSIELNSELNNKDKLKKRKIYYMQQNRSIEVKSLFMSDVEDNIT